MGVFASRPAPGISPPHADDQPELETPPKALDVENTSSRSTDPETEAAHERTWLLRSTAAVKDRTKKLTVPAWLKRKRYIALLVGLVLVAIVLAALGANGVFGGREKDEQDDENAPKDGVSFWGILQNGNSGIGANYQITAFAALVSDPTGRDRF